MATFSPSMKPASFKPWRNARRRVVSVDDGWRNPITGIAGCCPRARFTLTASSRPPPPDKGNELTPLHVGHGGLPPLRAISAADRLVRSVFRHLSLPQRGRLVLGADLNCSESRRWPALKVPPARPG